VGPESGQIVTGFGRRIVRMRADRLVAILMLLQTRGKVTAVEVAAELEVSERTARRDLDALGQAGLPVYSQPGRNGGWMLLGDGRTDLSGLTTAEARALFLVAGPAPASGELKAALRKLVRALPEPMRDQANAAATRVVVDPSGWDGTAAAAPPRWLDAVQHAVIEGEQLDLAYVARDGASTSRRIHPLGLAAKGRAWYLVADTERGLRTFRVDRVTDVRGAGEPVVRPQGFVLEDAWKLIADRVDAMRTPVVATGVMDAGSVGFLRARVGPRVRIGPAGDDGRVAIEVRGHSDRSLAAELAGFGALVEIHEPQSLRTALREVGEELVGSYSRSRAPAG
jgi:predicted DNA-binding transcriptional regulator YafY